MQFIHWVYYCYYWQVSGNLVTWSHRQWDTWATCSNRLSKVRAEIWLQVCDQQLCFQGIKKRKWKCLWKKKVGHPLQLANVCICTPPPSIPHVSCASWPPRLDNRPLPSLSQKPLCPQASCEARHLRTDSSTASAAFESGKSSFHINVHDQAPSSALSSLFKGFCCLAFISATHTCTGKGWSSLCLHRYNCVSGKIPPWPPLWIMSKFHSSLEGDN